MPRIDGRLNDQLRPVTITTGYLEHHPHSVMIEFGTTKVLCAATIENEVPRFKKGSGEGWITAEYGMLPCCSNERIQRERNKISGRTQEIQRLIGRSLRSVIDLKALGERTITFDADVIQADGGTRTAAITGSFVALKLAIRTMLEQKLIARDPVSEFLAAISVGMNNGNVLLDLPYIEDSQAEVDMNVVMTESGRFIEVQGTAEAQPFTKTEMDAMLTLAEKGIRELMAKQRAALGLSVIPA